MPLLTRMHQFKATGHSAAAHICIGFEPRFVIIYNETTLTEAAIGMWALTDDDGDGITAVAAGTVALETTEGISQYEGGDEPDGTDLYQDETGTALTAFATSGKLTPAGLTIGTNMSADGDVIHGIAFG